MLETLSQVNLHPSVQTIGEGCFSSNYAIKNIDLPENLVTISSKAFSYTGLTSIDIPDNVRYINSEAFESTSSLKTIKIGKSVVEIGYFAFRTLDKNYSSVYIRAAVPPKMVANTFDNYAATLYVPIGCKSAYANAAYWKNFINIVEIDFDGAESISLSDESVEMVEGDTYKLEYTITPADCKSNVIWTSSDTSVATVKDGVVTAVGPGIATIACTANDGSGVTASCVVTVKDDAGVDSVYGSNGLTVTAGNGFIRLHSEKSMAVTIFNMNGVLVKKVALSADEERKIALVPGVYIVNGAKYIVD